MRSLNLNIVIDRLICHDEGDGSGNAEPYIWAIFFKLDADTANFSPLGISGKRDPNKPVQVHFSRGSHSNLSSSFIDIDGDGMDAGDNIPIPADVGSWSTTLKSTIVPNPINLAAPPLEIPGMAGVLYMLLEEDAVPHGAAEAGHWALNNYFAEKVNEFVLALDIRDIVVAAGRPRATNEPTMSEIFAEIRKRLQEFKRSVLAEGKKKVIDAIKDSLSFPEIIAAGIDPDDFFGDVFVNFTQLEMIADSHRTFQNTLPVQMPSIGGGGLEIASDGVFTVTGYFHASPHQMAVIINDLPPGVHELFIDSTLKHYSGLPNKSFIRAIGGIHNGKPFVVDRFKAMQLIRNGQMRFFIRSAFGGADGKIEILAHAASPTQRFDYLKTENNETKADNLWSLPDCQMTYLDF